MLGPCDGPPPESFVTPLGNSLPTAANGSVAPLAPDASATMRTIRALRDERFDVLHVHEPLAPGPTMTTCIMRGAPLVATFHAAGRSSSYRIFWPLLSRMVRQHRREGGGVEGRPGARRSHLGGGDYRVLFNGVDIATILDARPVVAAEPTIFFCGRHEERKGLAVLLEAFAELEGDVRLWIGGDGPDIASLRVPHRRRPRRAGSGRIDDAEKFGRLRGASVFCVAVAARRVVRRGADRGDGRLHPRGRGGLAGYRNVATDGVDALLVEPGDPEALASALRRVLGDARSPPGCAPPARSGPSSSRWRASPTST